MSLRNRSYFIYEAEGMIDPPREIVGVMPSRYSAAQKKKAFDWLRKGSHEELVQYYEKLKKTKSKDAQSMMDLVLSVLRNPVVCAYCGRESGGKKCEFCGAPGSN